MTRPYIKLVNALPRKITQLWKSWSTDTWQIRRKRYFRAKMNQSLQQTSFKTQ